MIQELRIGNWVEYLGKNIQCDINVIHAVSKIIGDSVMYKAIPLTPEILTKCDFEMPSKVLTLDRHWFLYDNYDGFFIQIEKQSESEYICERFKIECKYLHQLQNLIFALTGKELNLNL